MTFTGEAHISKCVCCGKEIWGDGDEWCHEDTGLGSAPHDQWCHVSPDERHHEELPVLPRMDPKGRRYMDNEPACGAPKGWVWGYLPCGCRNDGWGNHLR